MKRMYSKSQIANMSGTQWYKHKIILKNGHGLLEMITLFNTPLQNITTIKTYPMILTNAAGPMVPRDDAAFPAMRCQNPGVFTIVHFGADETLKSYTLNVSDIKTEDITKI